ncbi:MAG: PRC-barrel domain-containing protein [Chloroflexota bacterium]
MKIDIGATVRTREGDEMGKVERVILDPTTRDVNALVVHRGLILNRDVVVPISLVQRADTKEVHLRLGRDYLHELPDFVDKHYVRPSEQGVPLSYPSGSILFPLVPPHGLPGVPGPYESAEEEREAAPLELLIAEGMEVRTVDGSIGVVDEVRTDPLSDRVTSIVVRKGAGLKKDIEIPTEFVAAIGPDHIQLSLTNQQVDELPLPVTDRYIVSEGDERAAG